MEQSRRIPSDQPNGREIVPGSAHDASGAELPNKVVVLASVPAGPGNARSADPMAAGKWPVVLERVRGAAHYIRAVEDRAQEYEQQVQELLQQVRADMQEADAKVRAAEQRVREVQTQAAALIQAADERARVSDERAANAEEWLRRISDAIESEFVVEPAAPTKTGTLGA
jgi:uncharacterized membrane protein YccC